MSQHDQNRIANKLKDIVDGNGLIFVLHGLNDDAKSSIIQFIQDNTNAVISPIGLLKRPSQMTVKIMSPIISAKYLIFDGINFINWKMAGNMKSLVHGEYFYRGLIGTKKLIILTDNPDIFKSDYGLSKRCTFIQCDDFNEHIKN